MDSIADMLVRIKNALGAKKDSVEIPFSRPKEEIAKILLAEGYIAKSEVVVRLNKKFLKLALKYTEKKESVIKGLKKVSTPGRRIYLGAAKIPRIQAGFGTAIISTSKGMMTDDAARGQKVGGEVICYIW